MSDIDEEINLSLIKLLLLFILELLYFLLYIALLCREMIKISNTTHPIAIIPYRINALVESHQWGRIVIWNIAGSSFQIPDRFAAFTLNV